MNKQELQFIAQAAKVASAYAEFRAGKADYFVIQLAEEELDKARDAMVTVAECNGLAIGSDCVVTNNVMVANVAIAPTFD